MNRQQKEEESKKHHFPMIMKTQHFNTDKNALTTYYEPYILKIHHSQSSLQSQFYPLLYRKQRGMKPYFWPTWNKDMFFFLFHVRKHCFPTVQHKGVASWIEKEEEWGGGGRRWVVTMELGSLLEKQTQKNGSLGKTTLFISLRLTKIQWLESIWSTSPNKMSLQSIQQSFVNTFRIYLKKNSFSLSISSAFYGYFSTLKHDQGNQGSNTAHGANSACLWAIARPVSANSPPPFHYFSFAPQPAPCCTDPMHFSHVLPVLALLHIKSDLLNLVYHVFISNISSLGGCVILTLFKEQCTWMVLQKQGNHSEASNRLAWAYVHMGLNRSHKIHHLSVCKNGTRPPLLAEHW